MKIIILTIFCLLFNFQTLCLAIGESEEDDNKDENRVLAVVNKEVITSNDLDIEKSIFRFMNNYKDNIDKKLDEVILEQIVNDKIYNIRAKELDIEVTDREVVEFIKSLGADQHAIQYQLKERDIPYSVFFEKLRTQVAWKKIIEQELIPHVKVSSNEIKSEKDILKNQNIGFLKLSIKKMEGEFPASKEVFDFSIYENYYKEKETKWWTIADFYKLQPELAQIIQESHGKDLITLAKQHMKKLSHNSTNHTSAYPEPELNYIHIKNGEGYYEVVVLDLFLTNMLIYNSEIEMLSFKINNPDLLNTLEHHHANYDKRYCETFVSNFSNKLTINKYQDSIKQLHQDVQSGIFNFGHSHVFFTTNKNNNGLVGFVVCNIIEMSNKNKLLQDFIYKKKLSSRVNKYFYDLKSEIFIKYY